MIIACPACSTRYVVPDSAIGVDGRTVRCAKCRHSWYQDGSELDLADYSKPQPAAAPVVEQPEPDQASAEARDVRPGFSNTHSSAGKSDTVSEPRVSTAENEHESVDRVPPPVVSHVPEAESADTYDREFSQFDYEPPFRPKRNPLKVWTAAGAIFAVLALGTVAAVSYYGLPDWVPISRPIFAAGKPDLVLDFPADQQDRRTLPDGSEYFSASGKITNVGRETLAVPSILIVMRDERERIVYSWEVPSPQPKLAPGEDILINEVVTDVPKSAKFAEIGWKPN
ncbi:MAG: zinc-ribbon domain-containing protein [Pontixanthobacter sp.]